MPTIEGQLTDLLKTETDSRGRVNLGADHANRDDIMVLVMENPTVNIQVEDGGNL